LLLQPLLLLPLPQACLQAFDRRRLGDGMGHSLLLGIQLLLGLPAGSLQDRPLLPEHLERLLIRGLGGLQSAHPLLQLLQLRAVVAEVVAFLLGRLQLGLLRSDRRFQLLAAFERHVQLRALRLQGRQRLAHPLQLRFRLLIGLLRCSLLGDLIADGFQIVLGLCCRFPCLVQGRAFLHLGGAVGTARGVHAGPAALDVVQHGQIQRRLHTQIGAGLEALHQAVVVVAGCAQGQGIAAGRSLPHPQMAPALLELIGGTTVACHGSGADQFRQPLFSVFPLQAAAGAVAQAGTAPRSREALAQFPAFTACLKAELHLRFRQEGVGLHGFEQFAAGFHRQEQGPVQGLSQGALAGLIGPGDHRDAWIEADGQVAVPAVIANAGREEAHGGELAGRGLRTCGGCGLFFNC